MIEVREQNQVAVLDAVGDALAEALQPPPSDYLLAAWACVQDVVIPY
ncbi:hypothetical protein [Rhodococcus sovatensis]|uniref:Uncharacterized protein n=1 Tax=Rhodococcus sovatensis TaxID=1805840 RepID=A0ABZ2PN35_9NOCA